MRSRPPLYVRVECKPALADMEKFKDDNGYYAAVTSTLKGYHYV